MLPKGVYDVAANAIHLTKATFGTAGRIGRMRGLSPVAIPHNRTEFFAFPLHPGVVTATIRTVGTPTHLGSAAAEKCHLYE